MSKTTQPDVSVIIPVYNGTKVAQRAIESVLAQKHTNWEVIAVDDGSTDASWELLTKLAAKEPRLRIDHIANSGQPARPRNHAIKMAQGRYVAFLDQDDAWRPDKLTKQLKRFEQAEVAVVYSDALVHDSRAGGKDFNYSSHMAATPSGDIVDALVNENFVSMLTAMVDRQWLNQVGPINETIPGVDDYELWLRIAMSGGQFSYINEVLADYYLSESNLSHQQAMMTSSLIGCYQAAAKSFPQYAPALKARIKTERQNLANFYTHVLSQQKGSWSGKISTAKKAYRNGTTPRSWLRTTRWLIRALF